jgi:hypothetical protein
VLSGLYGPKNFRHRISLPMGTWRWCNAQVQDNDGERLQVSIVMIAGVVPVHDGRRLKNGSKVKVSRDKPRWPKEFRVG